MSAWAVDGSRGLSQYVHDSWGADKGFTGGTIFAIAKSGDGYLWLGTEHGLVRFDGSEFTAVPAPLPDGRHAGAVRGFVEDADGALWVRLDGPRLLRYENGVFDDPVAKFGLSDAAFTAMSQDTRGELLLWGPKSGTLRFLNGRFDPISACAGINGIVISMLDSADGSLWLGARDAGLYRMLNGKCHQILSEVRLRSVNALAASGGGGVWIGSEAGLNLWEQGALVRLDHPEQLRGAQVFALTKDHHDNLWVGTDRGLFRIDIQSRKVTGLLNSTAGKEVTAIYEDNEGEIWFASGRTLQRLRAGMFASFSLQEPQLNENGGPIFVDDAGRTWFAPVSGGLFSLENGTIQRVPVPGLNNDVIYSISGGDGELWLGRQQGGLTELTRHGNQWAARTYTRKDGLAQDSVYTVVRTRDGTVWAGTVSGGVSVLRHGRFKNYSVDNGLRSNAIFSSMEASDGTMWFASPSGLVSFAANHWTTYGASGPEPSPNVRTVFEDSGHILWIGTSHGLARFDHGRIEISHDLTQALAEEVLGIGQDAQGFLWVSTAHYVLRVDRGPLLSGTLTEKDVLSYAAEDGLLETEGVRRDRCLVSDSSGRIWLSLPHSLAFADVQSADGYRWPAGVRIDSVSPAESYSPGEPLNVPPETRNITFRYSATALFMPERIQFRYRLDDSDQAWSQGDSLRQVVYTHLPPGRYTFRIMASNALGAWNGPETHIAFIIHPAFWQTWYFRLLCVVALAIAVVSLYRIRMFHYSERMNRRFQDRLAERTRIAQDLHDTLLQGVLSASLQLDIVQDHLPDDSPTRPMLRRVLQLMRQVTEEGREALRGLRSVNGSINIEAAFARLPQEAGFDPSPVYKVHVQGQPRQLMSVVRNEVYFIVREAVVNAFAHAQSCNISVTIEYGTRALRILVNDDGCGIDPRILKNGRNGHWGLAGMRERAEAIGSVLKIQSRASSGTDVELFVPAVIAFDDLSSRHSWWPWRRNKDYPKVRENGQPPP
jgi:ligand-binding sensor domain-containing protein/signal transduction histidine kinase